MKNAAYQMILKFYNANRTGLKHEIVFSQWLDIKCFITKCFRKYVFIDQPEYRHSFFGAAVSEITFI